ncbi:MAG TPA: MFS transporter, partial [Stellaceae bacterium]|nr:MFS transporter [Stellaceae bacterium]
MSDPTAPMPATSSPASPPSAPASPSSPVPPPIPWFALVAVLLGAFISTLNGRLSTFGLADIRGAVHAGFDEGAWITTSQTVAQMLVCPFALWVGANYGPKPVLRYAALAFALINLITPFYTDLHAFLALRFLGGVASGFFIPLTIGFILTNTPPRVWAYGIAMYALNLELSLNISASIEGWFIDHLSWRWIFWQNVPLGLAMALCLRFSGPAPPPKHMPSDLFGMVTAGIGFSLIYAALDQGNRVDWLNSGLICGLLVSGFIVLVAFVVHDARTPNPLINLKVAFAKPLPSMFVLISFLRLTILSTAFLVPQYLQVVRGFRSLEVGQTLLWLAVPQLIVCPLAGLLLRRFDPRMIASVGFLLISLSCYLIAHTLTPLWGSDQFLVSAVLQAVGQSFALSGTIFYGIQHIRPQDALTLGTMIQIARLMGGEVGQAF